MVTSPRLLTCALAFTAVASVSCSAPSKGALILAVSTDMQAPKDVDVVSLYVTTNGVPKFDFLGRVRPEGTVDLPSTLAIVEPDQQGAQVRIRVTAFRGTSAQVLRDVLTTVPHQRTALLRMPLDFVDEGSVTGNLPTQYVPDEATVHDGPTQFDPTDPTILVPTCDFTKGFTMVEGQCQSATVDSSQLPDYAAALVEGDAGLQSSGAPVDCFDVQGCFQGATPALNVDPGGCTFPLPAGADPTKLNVAVVTPATGACLALGACYVPLVEDPAEGWSVSNGTVSLAPGICSQFLVPGAPLGPAQLYVSAGGCAAETSSSPVCEPTTLDAGGMDAMLDAGAVDATLDAGAMDATPEAGPDCQAILGAMASAAISPPSWLGLDLSNAGKSDGSVGGGGLTIDQAGILACATYVEPSTFDAGIWSGPADPGYRQVMFGGTPSTGTPPITVEYNLQSREIYYVGLQGGYAGGLTFHSRTGGAYGTHTYAASVASLDGGGGQLLRDGVAFAPDWTYGTNDAGVSTASAWANEVYDGVMATFDPSVPAVPDCLTANFAGTNEGVPIQVHSCLYDPNGGTYYLGARRIPLYLGFAKNTSQLSQVYTFWQGGAAKGCGTPQASQELMTYSPINTAQGAFYGAGNVIGTQIGGLSPLAESSNPAGLTASETNTILGCNGASWSPPDPGYTGMQWGTGQVALESNLDSGIDYKLFAQQGYRGLGSISATFNGITTYYTFGVGTLLTNPDTPPGPGVGTPVQMDWAPYSTAVTNIANAFYESACGATVTSCVVSGDCSIVLNDGNGHSSFTLAPSPTLVQNCGFNIAPITFVFAYGGSIPEQIYVTNSGGQ
jgi:hypothetical protein